jgi:hypothetical protein
VCLRAHKLAIQLGFLGLLLCPLFLFQDATCTWLFYAPVSSALLRTRWSFLRRLRFVLLFLITLFSLLDHVFFIVMGVNLPISLINFVLTHPIVFKNVAMFSGPAVVLCGGLLIGLACWLGFRELRREPKCESNSRIMGGWGWNIKRKIVGSVLMFYICLYVSLRMK